MAYSGERHQLKCKRSHQDPCPHTHVRSPTVYQKLALGFSEAACPRPPPHFQEMPPQNSGVTFDSAPLPTHPIHQLILASHV